MYQNKRIGVIIAAAGSGSRMGSGIAKQYMKIDGLPAIVKVVKVFAQQDAVDCIWIVTGADQVSFCSEILKQYKVENDVKSIIVGGKERQDSVFQGLQGLDDEVDYVLIHDGARPFVHGKVINDVIAAMVTTGAAVAAVPVKDTIRQKTNESGATETLNRENLFAVQTPQGFEKNLLVSAYVRAFEDGFYGTDDAILVERLGVPVTTVMGGYDNIKITTKEDLPVEIKVGSGFDVHRLEVGRKLILGGVKIPFEKGLLGHSDADVLVHAIIDGLLGAAGLGDIGKHFPDTDCQYKDICSIALLERVSQLLQQQGYKVGNIDVTLMAEQPKIAPYIGAMVENLAQTLCVEQEKINIKATTTEKLGFVGREEGMACQAVCTLMKY